MKTLKQDFLMFRGTKKEVDAVVTIDKCFYFAWDTGEFYVGNKVGKKTKYGFSVGAVDEAILAQLNKMNLGIQTNVSISGFTAVVPKTAKVIYGSLNGCSFSFATTAEYVLVNTSTDTLIINKTYNIDGDILLTTGVHTFDENTLFYYN